MTTTNRFESIGSILNRVPPPPPSPDPDTAPEKDGGADDGHRDHAQGLPGTPATSTRAAPRRRRTGRADPTNVASQPALEPPALVASPKVAKEHAGERSSSSTGGARRVAFRLPPDLHTALVERASVTGSSHGQIVLDAVEAAHTQGTIADLVADSSAGGGLFPRLTTTRGAARPTVPVEIRLDARAVAILDDLTLQHQARSRTHLITESLKAYLQ